MTTAVLFDLDETLVVEEAAAVAAFEAAARLAGSSHSCDTGSLALAARRRARELWYATPVHPYCMRVGISSWEGLWCRFEGDRAAIRWLREWSPLYRREAWRLALAEQGVVDDALAERLGERFAFERRRRHETFADAAPALARLAESQQLALVTNGASCLQREKLAASGLGEHFEIVVVSAELDVGKPGSAIFEHALEKLDSPASAAAMVGDSLRCDVDGAIAAGLQPVWINRFGRESPRDRPGLIELATLDELPGVLV